MDWTEGTYTISTDKSLLSLDRICALLSKSYWACSRPREVIAQSLENSICYGIYDNGLQVGFGRIITDYATTYYICDVIVDEGYRGRGLGKKLIDCMVGTDSFIHKTGLLVTSDAHELYRHSGFTSVDNVFMMRRGT